MAALADDRLTVIVVDDDPLVRCLVSGALRDAGMTVVAEAGSGREAIELAAYYQPDLVLMDVVMADVDGLTATREVVARSEATKVVVFTSSGDDETGVLALRMGASGFLSKTEDVSLLPDALRAAHAGQGVASGPLTMRLIENLRSTRVDGRGLRPVDSPLTDREWEVLDLLADGMSPNDVAERLFLSVETVRSHVKRLMRKLEVRTRAEAVAHAERIRASMLADVGRDT